MTLIWRRKKQSKTTKKHNNTHTKFWIFFFPKIMFGGWGSSRVIWIFKNTVLNSSHPTEISTIIDYFENKINPKEKPIISSYNFFIGKVSKRIWKVVYKKGISPIFAHFTKIQKNKSFDTFGFCPNMRLVASIQNTFIFQRLFYCNPFKIKNRPHISMWVAE